MAETRGRRNVRNAIRASLFAATACVLSGVSSGFLSAQTRVPLLDRSARLDVEGVTLQEAVMALRQSSGVPIGFSPDLFPDHLRVTCHCLNLSVGEALDRILVGTGLEYSARRRQILIGRQVPQEPEPAVPPETIEGVILDAAWQRPLPGAEVHQVSSNANSLSGDGGRFVLRRVPAGSHMLRVRAVGYEEALVPVSLGEEEGATVRVELERAPIPLAEMVIAPGRFGILEATPGAMGSTISREDIEAIPSLGEDAFRTLNRMPGVASGDISGKLHVRGSTPRDLLVRLDGLELYEPYHLQDWDGMLGIVDVQSLGAIDLITGGFPAEFGDKFGGVFDMRTRQPPSGGIRTTVGASLGSVSLINQGDFANGRGKWLTSVRRGFLDIMLWIAGVGDDVSPSFYDVLGKAQYLVSDNHSLSVQLLHAGDDITWGDYGAESRVESRWSSSYGWLTWDASLTPRLRAETMISAGNVTRDRRGYGGDRHDGVFTPVTFDILDRQDFLFSGIKQDWQLDVTDDLLLKAGVDLRFNDGKYDYFGSARRRDLDDLGHMITLADTIDVRADRSANELGAYLSTRSRLSDGLTGELGVRFDGHSHTGDRDFAPRMLLRWDPGENTSVKASLGRYFQSQGIGQLMVTDGETVFSPSERAEQVALGVERRLGRDMVARVEAYTRNVDSPHPVYVNLAREIDPVMEIEADRTQLLPTAGRAKGVEFLLSNEGNGPLSWSASYVLASTELLVNERWAPRTLDQRHTFNLHAAYRRGTKWQLSGVWQYHTGWPYTEQYLDVGFEFDDDGDVTGSITRRAFGPLNARRLPDYHRMDLRITRAFELERGRLELYVDIFNAYDRENLRGYRYYLFHDYRRGRYVAEQYRGDELLPILPNIGFRWTF